MDGRPLSLVIPAYNESAVIRQAVAEADAALARITPEYEILIVDDGSRDATAEQVAEEMQTRPHVRLLRHAANRGYGAALRTGFEAARHDCIAFTDADCQFYLDDLALLLPLTEVVPVAAGYRVNRQDSAKRRFFSWGYNALVKLLLGTRVRDCDCALKVFRKRELAELLPQTNGFFVNTEMLTRARQRGYTVAEVGVRHRPRASGTSKVSLGDIPRTLAALLPFWWSRVLFPNPSPSLLHGARERPAATLRVAAPLLLVLMAALLFFSRLNCPLQEPEESRYAEIPRQMLETGSLAVPVLHGQPYLDKPPLLYWLVMASYTLFGVHDSAARLVPCFAAFLTVLVTYAWGRRAVGPRAAFLGAAVLCLSGRFVYLGRLLTMNGLLALCVVAALAAAHTALLATRLRQRWWLLSALACGLGLLTKGPVALILITVPVLACPLLDPRLARPRWRAWLAYCAVAAGVAAPWYITVTVRDAEFAGYFFWRHNVVRFLTPFDHEEPAWFYLPSLLLGMLPWSLLLPILVRHLGQREGEEATGRPAALGFFLLATLGGLAFFSAAGSKRAGYILPVMPPLALALGTFLDTALARSPALLLARYGYRLTGGVLAAGLAGVLVAMVAGVLSAAEAAVAVFVVVLGFAGWLRYGAGRSAAASWGLCGGATFLLLFAAVQLVLPDYARRFSMRGSLRPQAQLGLTEATPIVCYPRRWDSVSYYLRRNDVTVFTRGQRRELLRDLGSRPETLLVIKSDESLKELLRELPAVLEFVPRGRRGNVTVGVVRPRPVVPPTLVATRD